MEKFEEPKLVIIRGPSGVGKSTIVEHLMGQVTRPTVHIDQDAYRFIFAGMETYREVRRQMIKSNILIALRGGCDVILDGILGIKSYGAVFEDLLRAHSENNFAFYLEASLEETKRRHATRPKSQEFEADEMTEWYELASPLGVESEIIIPESSVLAESIATIRKVAGI